MDEEPEEGWNFFDIDIIVTLNLKAYLFYI